MLEKGVYNFKQHVLRDGIRWLERRKVGAVLGFMVETRGLQTL